MPAEASGERYSTPRTKRCGPAAVHHVFLYVHEEKRRAIAVYEAAGYRRDGSVRESDFRGVHLREPRLVNLRGSGPTHGSRLRSGPGRSWLSPSRYQKSSSPHVLTPLLMRPSPMGLSLDRVSPEVRAAHVQALREWDDAHAICEEYRAAATLDREHDQADRARERRIACPILVLWSVRGAVGTWYVEESGPIAIWQTWSDQAVQGRALDAGHFFPEEVPQETADALSRFFGGC